MADATTTRRTHEDHPHHHHHPPLTDVEREKKQKKALRRMGKILTKAWELPQAEPFQTCCDHDSSVTTTESSILCLTTLGQKVDEEKYGYGRHGWEDFAKDIGGIYNRHQIRKTKFATLAQSHLQKVCAMLSEKDESLAQVARTAPAPKEPPPVPIRRKSSSSSTASNHNTTTTNKRKSTTTLDPHGGRQRRRRSSTKEDSNQRRSSSNGSSINSNHNHNKNDSTTTTTPSTSYNGGGGGGANDKTSSVSNYHHHNTNNDKDLTISEREVRALQALKEFITSKGGDPSMVQNYRCRVTKKPSYDGRYDINYYNEHGRRFRSMVEVGRFFHLMMNHTTTTRSNVAGLGKMKNKRKLLVGGGASVATAKEIQSEKKKLRKELDRLKKQWSRASKSLDEFMTEDKESTFPVDDSLLLLLLHEDEYDTTIPKSGDENTTLSNQTNRVGSDMRRRPPPPAGGMLVLPTNCPAARIPDLQSFPGLPDACLPDVLQAWDFLCTFSRAISLQPIPLDDFVQCLTYHPPNRQLLFDGDVWKCPPVYLGEAHLALLKLILSDASSDEWWWSILETEETENAKVVDPAVDVAIKEEESDLPLIKVDFAALLADPEDPTLTSSWLQALQAVPSIKASDKVAMQHALDTAMGLMANKYALAYTRKAIQLGKTSGPSFMKRAVVWLIERVTEARPELSKQRTTSRSSSEAMKKRAAVVEEVSQQMEKLSSAALTVTDDDLLSDVEDDNESDDEGELEEENKKDDKQPDINHGNRDDEDRIASYIPPKPSPSLVDLLLPPSKPTPPSNLVSPTNWPQLAGAAACRVVHRYKRLRNEIDDSLRQIRELPRLTVRERRQREVISTGRVLTEFASHDDKDDDGPTERACNILCAGGDYLDLTPLERLALLRVLIEAAYDTFRVFEVVDSNYKQRTNAVKALITEQRRANKEAKEKAASDEAAARHDLATEAKNNFLEEKREEIRKLNENNNELTMEEVDALTEEDILDFDDDFKADFDALPTPESFKKAEVVERIARLQEAASFGTELLTVVSMDELLEREKTSLADMKQYLEELGGEEALMDPSLERSLVRKIEKLRRDIQKASESTEYLPRMRDEAIQALKDAIADGTIKSLRGAIRQAKTALLFGPDEETNGVVALDVVRDAHMELENAKHLKRVADAKKDLVSKLNKCFIRTEPLGNDRFRNAFWRFEYSDQAHIWAEVNPVLYDSNTKLRNEPGFLELAHDNVSDIAIGPSDVEDDFHPLEQRDGFRLFSRREYHQSGACASLVKRHWGCLINESSIRALMKGLDSRGVRENNLKKNLKEAIEEKTATLEAVTDKADEEESDEEKKNDKEALANANALHREFDTCGDEDAFENAKQDALLNHFDWIEPGTIEKLAKTAIGQKVRVRIVTESTKDGDIARYEVGTVGGWKNRKESVPVESGETEFEPQMKVVLVPFWRVWLDSCTEVWLSGKELLESIGRFEKWKNQDVDYFENDSTFLSYRNHLGRHCGKSADAALAMLPIRFGQYMVKCEADLYQGLKAFSLENSWGKSGNRNAWITSMRDYAFEFLTVKEGLLTLENALFELCGGSLKENPNRENTAKELLQNPSAREDIELESIDSNISGLWNSSSSRNVFLEIVSQSKTVSFLSLAFELVCRNTSAYIEANRVKNGIPTSASSMNNNASRGGGGGYEQYAPLPQRMTRRMNAWQQQQAESDQRFWSSVPVTRTTRRMNSRQQQQVSYSWDDEEDDNDEDSSY